MKTLSFTMGALLAACSDNQLHSLRDDAHGRGAGIEVTPARIDFGAVSDAEGVGVGQITITSVGQSDLRIEDVSIVGKDAARFRLVDEATSFMLAAGASMTLDVEFEPGDVLDAVGQVVVTSNDPVAPELPVDLRGSDAIPRIAVEPDPADFGVVEVGCESSRSIDLVSVGEERVTVESIAANGDGYVLSYGFALPQTLAPGERLSVDLTFAPDDERDFPGILEVGSDDYYGPQTGQQFGAGLFGSLHEESWTLEDQKADILFYVDHSGSMLDDAVALADNFAVFIGQLNDHSSDWQIAVASNENGCNLTGILSPSMSDYVARFENGVTTTMGQGTYDEAGLTVATLAVDATDAGECNVGFLREDALLHVILVSDEPEYSADNWDTYVDRLVAKKGDADLVRVSAIAGTADDQAVWELYDGLPPEGVCAAEEGRGYIEAVDATDGTFLSICSDWASSMGALADETLSQATFPLIELDTVPASIEVTVDGQPATGWTFDVATNSVVFDAASAPMQGSTVVVDYATYATCE